MIDEKNKIRKLQNSKYNLKELINQKFNRLTITDCYWIYKNNRNIFYIDYICECGNQGYADYYKVKTGSTKSCGCYTRDRLKYNNNLYKHGKTETRLFSIWINMHTRCFNVNNSDYKYYGARGITICLEWLDNFMVFYNWAMQNGYQDNLTIDRIDNNGNYEPNNCRWATQKKQNNNKRNNHLIEYNGNIQTLKQWAIEIGLSPMSIKYRLDKGWSVDKVLNKYKYHGNRYKTNTF